MGKSKKTAKGKPERDDNLDDLLADFAALDSANLWPKGVQKSGDWNDVGTAAASLVAQTVSLPPTKANFADPEYFSRFMSVTRALYVQQAWPPGTGAIGGDVSPQHVALAMVEMVSAADVRLSDKLLATNLCVLEWTMSALQVVCANSELNPRGPGGILGGILQSLKTLEALSRQGGRKHHETFRSVHGPLCDLMTPTTHRVILTAAIRCAANAFHNTLPHTCKHHDPTTAATIEAIVGVANAKWVDKVTALAAVRVLSLLGEHQIAHMRTVPGATNALLKGLRTEAHADRSNAATALLKLLCLTEEMSFISCTSEFSSRAQSNFESGMMDHTMAINGKPSAIKEIRQAQAMVMAFVQTLLAHQVTYAFAAELLWPLVCIESSIPIGTIGDEHEDLWHLMDFRQIEDMIGLCAKAMESVPGRRRESLLLKLKTCLLLEEWETARTLANAGIRAEERRDPSAETPGGCTGGTLIVYCYYSIMNAESSMGCEEAKAAGTNQTKKCYDEGCRAAAYAAIEAANKYDVGVVSHSILAKCAVNLSASFRNVGNNAGLIHAGELNEANARQMYYEFYQANAVAMSRLPADSIHFCEVFYQYILSALLSQGPTKQGDIPAFSAQDLQNIWNDYKASVDCAKNIMVHFWDLPGLRTTPIHVLMVDVILANIDVLAEAEVLWTTPAESGGTGTAVPTMTSGGKTVNLKRCDGCSMQSAKLLKCGRCLSAQFCSEECQKASWKVHKQACVKVTS